MTADSLHTRIWQELTAAVHEPTHSWRRPVLATVDAAGLPQARTVVLRESAPQSEQLSFYTDHRSPKVQQLRQNPRAQLLFWCRTLSWQLRVEAEASVVENPERIAQLWTTLADTTQARDYLRADAPGSQLSANEPLHPDRHNLTIVDLKVLSFDWLELNRDQHLRARIQHGQVEWLTP